MFCARLQSSSRLLNSFLFFITNPKETNSFLRHPYLIAFIFGRHGSITYHRSIDRYKITDQNTMHLTNCSSTRRYYVLYRDQICTVRETIHRYHPSSINSDYQFIQNTPSNRSPIRMTTNRDITARNTTSTDSRNCS